MGRGSCFSMMYGARSNLSRFNLQIFKMVGLKEANVQDMVSWNSDQRVYGGENVFSLRNAGFAG